MDVAGVYSTAPTLYNEISVAIDSKKFHLAYKDSNNVIIKAQGPLLSDADTSKNAKPKPIIRLVPVLLPVVEDVKPDAIFKIPTSYTLVNKQHIRLLVPKQNSEPKINKIVEVTDITQCPDSLPSSATKVTIKDKVLSVHVIDQLVPSANNDPSTSTRKDESDKNLTKQSNKFQCNHCNFSTLEFKEFWNHIQEHNVNLDCPLCDKAFTFKDSLHQHLKNVHGAAGINFQSDTSLEPSQPQAADSSESSNESSLDDDPNSPILYDDEPTPEENSDNETELIKKDRKSLFDDKQEDLFYCGNCGHTSEDFESFAAHYATHKQTKEFLCPLCDKLFNYAKALSEHMTTDHKLLAVFDENEDMRIYPQDGQQVASLMIVESKDYRIETEAKKEMTIEYHCQVCGVFDTNYEKYSEHIKSAHVKPCSCPSCKIMFENELQMFEHLKTKDCGIFAVSSKGNFRCELCAGSAVFHVEKDLNRHLKNIHNQPLLKCVFCEEKLHTKKLQSRHMLQEHPFGCRQCQIIFCTDKELYKHRLTHAKKDFHCEICGKTFHRPNYFRDHQNHHKGIKTHRCKFCDKMFSYYTNLVEHKFKEHVKKPKQLCELCGKTFKAKQNLLVHVRTVHGSANTEKKPELRVKKTSKGSPKKKRRSNFESKYRCQFCGVCYCNAFILKQHTHIHLRPSQFQCNECNLFFKSSKTLEAHVEQLCNESEAELLNRQLMEPQFRVDRRFKCIICNVMTVNSWILKQHMVVHYKENDFKCDCGLYFKTKDTLKYHKEVRMCDGSPAPMMPNFNDPNSFILPDEPENPEEYEIVDDEAPANEVYEMIELGDEDSQMITSNVAESNEMNVVVQQVADGEMQDADYVIHLSEDGTPLILPKNSLDNIFVGQDGVQYVVKQVAQ